MCGFASLEVMVHEGLRWEPCFLGCGMVQEMLNYMQHPDTEFDSQEMVTTIRLWGRYKNSPQWHGFTTNREIQIFLFSSILFSDGG